MSGGAFSGVIQTCLDVEDVPTFGGYGKLMIALMWERGVQHTNSQVSFKTLHEAGCHI
jgi:hypothetical protein